MADHDSFVCSTTQRRYSASRLKRPICWMVRARMRC